ncbi:hypothetical protein [Rhizobium sp. BK176]|nr:hypothetical protein [Rhizobium sp. BK176]MCS4090031.1 hypothetical protein [Rhizobium sp. BK176]
MANETNYELLFECFTSGQMSRAQLERHMTEDEVFRAWVDKRVKDRRRAA